MKVGFKDVLLLIAFGLCLHKSYGQPKYGNEWINPSKIYFKINVAEDGIYKVTFEELVLAGFPLSTSPSSDLQLINFGKEQAIHVSGNSFGPGSWFEFYGQKHTIGLDTFLYKDWKKDLLNPEYSFVSDTNAYFLTISPESSNLRYTLSNPDYINITLAPFPFYLHEEKVVYKDSYFKNVDGDIRYSHFEPSEGFASGIQQQTNTTINITSYYEDGPAPILDFRTGQNNQISRLEIKWNNVLKETKLTLPKLTTQHQYALSKSDIKASNVLNLRNVNTTLDRHVISYASVRYPRTFDFGNKPSYAFNLTSSSQKRFLEISSFKDDNTSVFLYDINNKIRYSTKIIGGKTLAIVNGVSTETSYILSNTGDGFKKAKDISKFTPRNFENRDQQFIILTSKALHTSGADYVQQYADYRSSSVGGGYKTEIVDIEDVYNHFGYGVERHFMGVKNLASYIKNKWTSTQFVLILGKGIEYPYMRTENDVLNNVGRVFFVPTYGFVGSDNMLFSEENFPDPYFALGRIAARSGDDIRNYLDKLRQYEQAPLAGQTIQDKYWMKRVMNLGGGKNDFEQNAIKSGLDNMARILADTIYGADVRSYFKRSSDAVQFNVNEEINTLFENGVGIINFFGHSAANSWDFSIDNPRNFDNFGRFPLINSFGCYSGNLHSTAKGISELFVLEKDRGSIAFLASTGTAFISSLTQYGQRFYNTTLHELRYKSVGEAITRIANQYRNAQFADLALYSQLTYHGDPAIKLYVERGPDYVFDGSTVKSKSSTIEAGSKDFEIDLVIANLGSYIKDSLDVIFSHVLPNGTIIDTITVRTAGIASNEKVTIKLKNYGNVSVGKNILRGTLDPKNKIKELPTVAAENNNDLVVDGVIGFEFFVTDNFATAVYPHDFAMINTKDHFVLKASTSSVPVAKGNYIFQIDTTAYYNSPIKETGKVESEGGLITYTPKMALVADRVYYWRVSPDSISKENGYKWSEKSFAYLPNEEEGWNQSHFFQFRQNEFTELELSEATGRKFEFGKIFHTAKFKNKLWVDEDRPGYTFDNVTFGSVTPWNYMSAGLAFVIYKQQTGIFPRNAVGGEYGSINPTSGSIAVYPFKTDSPKSRNDIVNFIKNQLSPNDFLTVFTVVKDGNSDLKISDWESDKAVYGTTLFDALKSIGANQFENLKDYGSVPYILQTIVGDNKILNEQIALNKNEIIEITSLVNNYSSLGSKNTLSLGKVNVFKELKFSVTQNPLATNNYWLDILNIDNFNNTTKVDSFIKGNKILNYDGKKYSSLNLKLNTFDSIQFQVPQLKFWRVSYKSLPDAAILFTKSEPNPSNNEVNLGEKVKISYDVISVNYVDMDSILVKFSYIASDNVATIKFKKLAPLKAGQKINDIIEFDIPAGNINDIRFVIEINPDGQQPELHSFNNVLTKQFNISKDDKNPLLDVFFDGIRIMDGDIVSPKPEILITLEDDNKFLPITDPNLFDIKLDTGRNQLLTIPVNSSVIRFTPASTTNTTAKITYTPSLSEGEYKLIVQAKDLSGNKSGVNPRIVSFRVIEKQSISHVFNYPNPFSTSTQFVFTLTGEEIPDIMSISIMTISGKVVREIKKEELGVLRVGINKTDFKWDGTDEYGSKLANGVYLYKVNTRKSNGDTYDHFANEKVDAFFTEGFGKLVILR